MKTRSSYATLAFTVAIIVFVNAVIPQDAFARHGSRTLVGSWVVNIIPDPGGPPPFVNLATFDRSGTVVTAEPGASAGHGLWERIGKRDFEMKFLQLVDPGNPLGLPPGSILTVTAFLTVDRGGDEASGSVIGVFSDSAGNELAVVSGSLIFTRITLD